MYVTSSSITLDRANLSLSSLSKVVLLVRNPFDANVAEYNRRAAHDHKERAESLDEYKNLDEPWDPKVKKHI